MVAAGVLLPAVAYATFAIFWSALYLLVSALSGIQQEIARAVSPRSADAEADRPPTLRNFTIQAATAVTLACLLLLTVMGPGLVVIADPGLATPLSVGAGAYVLLAVLAGTVSALAHWHLAALITILDAILRLILVGACLLLESDAVTIAWAVVAPMPITAVIAWLVIRGATVGRVVIDVRLSRLWLNVGRTVVGGAAMGILISGFPFMVGATSVDVDPGLVASLIFAVNVARAPLVIVALSLQSYFIVLYQRGVDRRATVLLVSSIGVGALVAAVIAGAFGPGLLTAVFPDAPTISSLAVGSIVASGGLVGIMCLTGPMTIARSSHTAYTAGWIVAAALTVATLFSPLDVVDRVVLGLVIGPLCGVLVHAVALVRRPRVHS